MTEEVNAQEKRVRALTNLYYSNPKIQELMIQFSTGREVVPRYYTGFGKRPDSLNYASDIMGLVKRGATSFHASEEIWNDPLSLNSEMTHKEMENLRKSWDLLIDIDSPFLDCSKIAARLIIDALEQKGVAHYGIKFSGSKGFHLIVPGSAFPDTLDGEMMKARFPEWPRAICKYLAYWIRPSYNKEVGKIVTTDQIEKRTKLKKEDLEIVQCVQCERNALKGTQVKFRCPLCGTLIERKDYVVTKRQLRCVNNTCTGILEVIDQKEYYYCEHCKDPRNEKMPLSSDKYQEFFVKMRGIPAEEIAALDLVLVAPRHLFRMPYSLHEKTALASVVITKDELEGFGPKDADPLKVQLRQFYPQTQKDEGRRLLREAIEWMRNAEGNEEKSVAKKFEGKAYEGVELKGVTEAMFPAPIKKLLLGLEDGKKRGLFVLVTFLRSANFSLEDTERIIRQWNEKNSPPLKEGYLRSQLEWHFKQRKKIMPPNYDNESYYKDLGLLDKKPDVKNPIVDVARAARRAENG